ncbi:luciferin sulfotransferase isoform X2 [Hyalella azteca]|nr:luciferin sulfotransferase isoform X2 [Hyalella azteca]
MSSRESTSPKSCNSLKPKFPYDLPAPCVDDVLSLRKRYSGYLSGAVAIGPQKYYMQGIYNDYAEALYEFQFRPSDVVVASYPKTGTTWTEELVWLLLNNFDYSQAKTPLDMRFPFLEADCIIDRRVFEFPEVAERMNGEPPPGPFDSLHRARDLPDRRALKTHLPFSLLSPELLRTSKVVYVTRDPRDVAVSFYHHHKIILSHGFSGTIDEFIDDFIEDKVLYSPFWSHVREAWEKRDEPNLLIITYEELKSDLPAVILRIASFLDVSVSDAQLETLTKHLHIDSMRCNPAINPDHDPIVKIDPHEGGFVRKGAVGGWRSSLSETSQAKLEAWMRRNAQGLDQHFGWT